MQKILAITWLTWKAALRFRLFAVVGALLVLAVVGLPLIVKDDGTPRGFAQIILTYTLSAVTVLLGFSTLWISCGALARDIEECQIQVVATKPVARWQIWLGKWLGIASLNAVLLVLAGACIYGLLVWRAAKLPLMERAQLRQELLVARGSAREADNSAAINAETEQLLQNRLKSNPGIAADLNEVRKQIREQVASDFQLVPPGYVRQWNINLGTDVGSLRNQPLQLRVKFESADHNPNGTYVGLWEIGNPDSTNYAALPPMSLAPDTFHEFEIPPNLYSDKGVLSIVFVNQNNVSLLFPLEDGMEVLYPQGSFTANFIRALGIIFCWLVLLSAIGLMSASFLSFPVAAFFSITLLITAFSTNTLAETVDLGTVTTGSTPAPGTRSITDTVFIPIFKGMLDVLNLVEKFSPIDALSTGRSVPAGELAAAFGQIVVLFGGAFAAIGIYLFSRRELAAAQNQ
ncbi:MAG TPA: ABC transporter permease [Verrucomicrobiae bacterium]|nr:ABC transporter permease [Verrucomicrobiae bacterium]